MTRHDEHMDWREHANALAQDHAALAPEPREEGQRPRGVAVSAVVILAGVIALGVLIAVAGGFKGASIACDGLMLCAEEGR